MLSRVLGFAVRSAVRTGAGWMAIVAMGKAGTEAFWSRSLPPKLLRRLDAAFLLVPAGDGAVPNAAEKSQTGRDRVTDHPDCGRCRPKIRYGKLRYSGTETRMADFQIEQLKEAVAANKHVPRYLLGDAEIDREPDQYAIGFNEEAIICANECSFAWQEIPGALDWLRAQAAKPSPRRGKPRGPKRK